MNWESHWLVKKEGGGHSGFYSFLSSRQVVYTWFPSTIPPQRVQGSWTTAALETTFYGRAFSSFFFNTFNDFQNLKNPQPPPLHPPKNEGKKRWEQANETISRLSKTLVLKERKKWDCKSINEKKKAVGTSILPRLRQFTYSSQMKPD